MFRLDRLATLYCFYPLKKMKSSNEELRIPILMYHSISEDNENGVHPYYRTSTSPNIFAGHMKFLYENNYSVIDLNEAVCQLEVSKSIKHSTGKQMNFVVITFDDGFRDFYTQAFPILRKYGFVATVFLPTSFIDKKELKLKKKEHLRWDEVKQLHKNGIRFGSHTVTHPQLKLLKIDEIEYELKHSKETLEEKIGNVIDSFSYPYAFPEENKKFKTYIRDVLYKCKYKNGVTTRLGTATKKEDKYFLKRIPINSCDDFPLLRAKLENGYDWLHKPQYLFKLLEGLRVAK
jgi:peptidoglycan/xylan/chitin deacetylase (PgdA/CDA1 family)